MLIRRASSEGTSPCSGLSYKSSVSSLRSSPSSDGIVPERRFASSLSEVSSVSLPSSVGIVPERRALPRCRWRKL